MSDSSDKFEGWCLVEVMGHSRYAGFVTEQAIGGCNFVRVDVPAFEGSPAFTKLLGQSSIFAITPVTEQIAKGMAQKFHNTPINVYDLPEAHHQRALAYDRSDDEYDEEGI
jgi:hypothetical protein